MDQINNNNQSQPVSTPIVPPGVSSEPIVSATPPPSPAPEKVGNSIPKTDRKFLAYGALIGLFVVAIVAVAGFYFMYPKSNTNEVAVAPTPAVEEVAVEPTPAEVAEVEQVGDLDNLIVGLAQADSGLDQELAALEKDSNF